MPLNFIGDVLGTIARPILGAVTNAVGVKLGSEVENFTDRIAGIDSGAMRRQLINRQGLPGPSVPTGDTAVVPSPYGFQPASFQTAGLGGLIPALTRGLPAVGTASRAIGGGRISGILATARANTGRPVTSRRIVSLVREFGWAAVGAWFGLNQEDLMEIWMHQTRRRRRRWTPKDRARGRAYINYLKRCERELNNLRPAARRRRSTSGGSGHRITQVK